MQSRELEQKIIDHSVWKNICRQQEDGRCHAPASFATVVYATEIESGASEPLYEIADKCALNPTYCLIHKNVSTLLLSPNNDYCLGLVSGSNVCDAAVVEFESLWS